MYRWFRTLQIQYAVVVLWEGIGLSIQLRRVRSPSTAPKFVVIRVKKARIIRKARFNVSSILSVRVRSAEEFRSVRIEVITADCLSAYASSILAQTAKVLLEC